DAIAGWLPGSDRYGNQQYWATRSLGFLALYRGDLDTMRTSLNDRWRQWDASLFRRIPIMRAEGSWVRGGCELALAHDARARGDHAAFARHRRGAARAFSELRRAGI